MSEEIQEIFDKFMDSQVRTYDMVAVMPIDYTWWYGKNQKLTPVLKDKCSYCGLVMDGPQIQHDDCIKLQIEVKKNPSPKSKDSATVDVCALWIKKQWEGIILPKMYLGWHEGEYDT